MFRIAIANHKGGVGKTTTCHALGVALACDYHQRVLMIDLDPQSSLTEACGIESAAGRSLAEVFGGASVGKLRLSRILRPLMPGLDLAPADIALAESQLGLAGRLVGRDTVLKRELDALNGTYDLALMDCPPNLDLLTLNALVAATHVLVPTKPQVVDLRGLRLFLQTLDAIQTTNPDLALLGVLLTFYEGFALHKRALSALQDDALPVFQARIGKSVRVAEGPEQGQSIIDYAPLNPRAAEYRALAVEVLQCLTA